MSAWNYVVTAQKPTSVSHSVVGNFTGAKDVNLIIAKHTRLEVHLITATGRQALLDVPIYGRIAVLQLFRPPGAERDLLFITTERLQVCVIGWDPATGQLVTKAGGYVGEKIGKPADKGLIGTVEPRGRMLGLYIYTSHFKVIPIDAAGGTSEAFNIRLEELEVLCVVFLHGCDEPTIAVLYEDQRKHKNIKTYVVNRKDKEFEEGPFNQLNLDSTSSNTALVAVPEPLGGVLVIGEAIITYINRGHSGQTSNQLKSVRTTVPATCGMGMVDADGSRWLIGDCAGMLHVLSLRFDTPPPGQSAVLQEMTMEPLGKTSYAKTISYLDHGCVYIGSHEGDCQLIHLSEEPLPGPEPCHVEELERFDNLAPVRNMVVMDLERQGQGQVVTCSGLGKDGTLRVVRNGIGINEQAVVPLEGVKGIWSLRASTADPYDTFLVVSFIRETRVMAIQDEELEETEITGFDCDRLTLFTSNVLHDQIIQVTSRDLRLVHASSRELVTTWHPQDGCDIHVATANASQILLAVSTGCGGGRLVYLEVGDGQLLEVQALALQAEISCIDITPIGPDPNRALFAAVGLWSKQVEVYRVPELERVQEATVGGEVIPRSVLLCLLEQNPYLLIGLGDGQVINYQLDPGTAALSDAKRISLGTQPITFRPFKSHGATHVFASSDRPTVIYSSNNKLLYSNVNQKEVSSMSPFNSKAFPESLAMSVEETLSIGTIDNIQKLHIRTVPLHVSPTRLVHCPLSRTLLVGSFPSTIDEADFGALRLVDSETFEITQVYALGQHTYPLDRHIEFPAAMATCSFANDPRPYYVVGTAFVVPSETEPTKGRILVFEVQDDKLVLVHEKVIKGAAYQVQGFQGKLLACINGRVQLFRWEEKELMPECARFGMTLAICLATHGMNIIVGDLMKSVILLEYKPEEQKIEGVAFDHETKWTTASICLDDNTHLNAEAAFNLYTTRKTVGGGAAAMEGTGEALSSAEQQKLEVVGEYHLGDQVNAFAHGSLVMRMPDSSSERIPTVLYASMSGAIGLVASLPEAKFLQLQALQTAINKVVKGVGGLSHDTWRSFSNELKFCEPAHNFVDGDQIETFLDLKRDAMQTVADHVGAPLDDLCKLVEEMSRLH